MAKIILTDHAAERTYERAVRRRQITRAVTKPDARERESDGDTRFTLEVQRGGETRRLVVVAKPLPDEGPDTWLVKTVFVRGEDDPNAVLAAWRALKMRLFYRKRR